MERIEKAGAGRAGSDKKKISAFLCPLLFFFYKIPLVPRPFLDRPLRAWNRLSMRWQPTDNLTCHATLQLISSFLLTSHTRCVTNLWQSFAKKTFGARHGTKYSETEPNGHPVYTVISFILVRIKLSQSFSDLKNSFNKANKD